ncbi:MAG: hypothetical protein ACE5KM_04720 [Planctomycetaceae bacterium]
MSDPQVLDRQIDRLIDGELDQAEQRRLLETLETQPDSWRAVALGFVETQLMRSELIAWNPASASATAIAEPAPSAAQQPAGPGRLAKLMTIAAAAVAAFAIGIAARNWWPSTETAPPGRPLADAARKPPANKPVMQVQRGLSAAGNESLRRVNLPLVPAGRVDPRLLYSAPAVSPELKAALQRMGHVVHEERRFYSLRLSDGRRVLVPVNEIRVQFVGNKVIQ